MTNGPMQVGLTIYEDFIHYKTGIYKHETGEVLGRHAIKILGWGTDDTEGLYWIVQNQWGVEWGMNGYMNIKAG